VSLDRLSGVREVRSLPPAKAGLFTTELAYPGLRSRCSLHPGLHSATCFAGSLSGFELAASRRNQIAATRRPEVPSFDLPTTVDSSVKTNLA